MTKTGSGAWTLDVASSYSGGTTLNAGTLYVQNGASGSALGSGTLTINGGTLAASTRATGSTGPIGGLVQANTGTIAPGGGLASTYGTLNLNGGLSASPNATLLFDLGAAVASNTYGGDLIDLAAQRP